MPMTFREALLFALDHTGVSLQRVADGAGVSYEQLKKVKQRDTARTNVEDARRIACFFKVSLDDFLHGKLEARPTIAIAGKVGAGARVPLADPYEKGAGPQAECPPGLSPFGIVAVEVEGDSMEPVYSSGDLLFYTRTTSDGVPIEAIGKRCVCEDVDGMAWVKQVRLGSEPGLFNLVALNPSSQNMHDVRLKWAAPIRLHWPAELANRLDDC